MLNPTHLLPSKAICRWAVAQVHRPTGDLSKLVGTEVALKCPSLPCAPQMLTLREIVKFTHWMTITRNIITNKKTASGHSNPFQHVQTS